MATQTTVRQDASITTQRDPREKLLRRVLFSNIAFSTASASLFLIANQAVADGAGIADVMLFNLLNGVDFITFIGAGLVGFALYMMYVVTRNPIDTRFVWSIVFSDFAWVGLSWLLLATGAIPFSTAGNWGVLIIADIVLLFAIGQIVGIRRINR